MKNILKFLFIFLSLHLASTPSFCINSSDGFVNFLINAKAVRLVTNLVAYKTKKELDNLNSAIGLKNKDERKKLKGIIKKYLKKRQWRSNNKQITEYLNTLDDPDALTDENFTNLSFLLALGDMAFEQPSESGSFEYEFFPITKLSRKSKSEFLSLINKDKEILDFDKLIDFLKEKFSLADELFTDRVANGQESLNSETLKFYFPKRKFITIKELTGKSDWEVTQVINNHKQQPRLVTEIDISRNNIDFEFTPRENDPQVDRSALFSQDVYQGHKSIRSEELSEHYPNQRFISVKNITGEHKWLAVMCIDGKQKEVNLNQIDLSEKNAEYYFYPTYKEMYKNTDLEKETRPFLTSHHKKVRSLNATDLASRGRSIALAANRFRKAMNETYPESFNLTSSDENMFHFTLDGTFPVGIYKGARIKLQYDFSNVSNEGPNVTIINSPDNAHKYGQGLCLANALPYSAVFGWWEGREVSKYSSHVFPIEQQFLNPLMFLMTDYDATSEGSLSVRRSRDQIANYLYESIKQTYLTDPENAPTIDDILKRLKEAESNNANDTYSVLALTPREDKIKEITFTEDSFQPGLYDIKGNRTDFFLPVSLTPFSRVIEFEANKILCIEDLKQQVYAFSDQSLCNEQYVDVYVDGKRIEEDSLQEELQQLIESNKANRKHSTKHNKLALISYFDPKEIQKGQEPEETALQIHLYSNKNQAKRSKRTWEFNLDIPKESIRPQERFNGGLQYGKSANAWIPDIREDMSETEKQASTKATANLGEHFLRLPNEQKDFLAWKTNEIIFKSMMGPLVDVKSNWLPTEAFMQLLLSRIRMALRISSRHDKLLAKTQTNFDDCLKGTISKNNLPDFSYLPIYLVPAYTQLEELTTEQKKHIRHDIFLNAIKECLTRILTYAAKGEKNYDHLKQIVEGIDLNDRYLSTRDEKLYHKTMEQLKPIDSIRSFYENPDNINIDAIEEINPTGIGYLVNLLSIMDAVFVNESIEQFPDKSLSELQTKIKNIKTILSDPHPKKLKRIINKELSELIELTSDIEKNLVNDVMTEFFARNKKNRADIPRGYEKMEDDSSNESLTELLESIDRIKPRIYTNVAEDLGDGMTQYLQTCRHCLGEYKTKTKIRGTKHNSKYNITPLHSECAAPFKTLKKDSEILWRRIKSNDNKPQHIAPKRNDYHVVPTDYRLIKSISPEQNQNAIAALHQAMNSLNPDSQLSLTDVQKRVQDNLSTIKACIERADDKDRILLKSEFSNLIDVPVSVIDELIDKAQLSYPPSTSHYTETTPYSVLLSFNPLPVMAISEDLDIEIKVPDMSPIRRTAQNDWLLKAPNLLHRLNETPQRITNPRLKSIHDEIKTNSNNLEALMQEEKTTLEELKIVDKQISDGMNPPEEGSKEKIKQLQIQLDQTRKKITSLKDVPYKLAHKHSENSSEALLVRYDHDAGYPTHYDLAMKKPVATPAKRAKYGTDMEID